jgi:hypothetical protein
MVDSAGRDRLSGHLFETDSLATELEIIVAPLSARTVLIFHRVGNASMKLHDIAFADKSQPIRPEWDGALDPNALLGLSLRNVDLFMNLSAAKGVEVLVERLLHVDQRALTGAVAVVLQHGEKDEVGIFPRWHVLGHG